MKSYLVTKQKKNHSPLVFNNVSVSQSSFQKHLGLITCPYNMSFHQKLESTQHNASFAITSAIGGTPKEKFSQELRL